MSLDSSQWPTSHPTHYDSNTQYNSVHPSHLSLFLPQSQPQPHSHSHSHSSSRTPTPTNPSPFLPFQRHDHLPPQQKQPKRHRASHPYPYPIPSSSSTSASITSAEPQPQPQPRQRRSQSHSQPLPPSHTPSSISASTSIPLTPQKPALLSASQKKANHIQSEQKRRANIRRGYEALCECVPALREAIREEEETAAAANERGDQAGKRKPKVPKGRDNDGDKIDGRAGPRSENVVLSKTIDYINDLLDERSALLARLHRARSSLPPGHPALTPIRRGHPPMDPFSGNTGGQQDVDCFDNFPLWEREWKGGHGNLGNMEEGEDSS
ncbi:hypothetical protein BDZ94DRAFT_1157805 [Collybia nuda]|uniref:BHLH domain-containing protein n=1 Tax=Collybia nuda TaxID=64659 RepID=A0A9P5YC99_9AGAR|nr:hypothetical protein BDZ94DRAFT_1157805 [Collybia nuda]